MEISKYIRDALEEGSIDKVSKGIEQLVMMMINAIGMIEQREVDFEKRLEVIEEDLDVIKSFLLSKPIPLPGSTQPTSQPPKTPSTQPTSVTPAPTSPVKQAPLPPAPPKTISTPTELPSAGPSEEDIIAFRQKLLKPTPKYEKQKPQPVSIRAALMQEIKEHFGSAKSKMEKEK